MELVKQRLAKLCLILMGLVTPLFWLSYTVSQRDPFTLLLCIINSLIVAPTAAVLVFRHSRKAEMEHFVYKMVATLNVFLVAAVMVLLSMGLIRMWFAK